MACPRIRKLDISFSSVNSSELSALSFFENLKILNVNSTKLDSLSFLRDLKNLNDLSICGNTNSRVMLSSREIWIKYNTFNIEELPYHEGIEILNASSLILSGGDISFIKRQLPNLIEFKRK